MSNRSRAKPVNGYGHGKFVALKNSNHFFHHAKSMQESFRYFKPAEEGPFGKFNPTILKTVQDWLDETVGSKKQVGDNLDAMKSWKPTRGWKVSNRPEHQQSYAWN